MDTRQDSREHLDGQGAANDMSVELDVRQQKVDADLVLVPHEDHPRSLQHLSRILSMGGRCWDRTQQAVGLVSVQHDLEIHVPGEPWLTPHGQGDGPDDRRLDAGLLQGGTSDATSLSMGRRRAVRQGMQATLHLHQELVALRIVRGLGFAVGTDGLRIQHLHVPYRLKDRLLAKQAGLDGLDVIPPEMLGLSIEGGPVAPQHACAPGLRHEVHEGRRASRAFRGLRLRRRFDGGLRSRRTGPRSWAPAATSFTSDTFPVRWGTPPAAPCRASWWGAPGLGDAVAGGVHRSSCEGYPVLSPLLYDVGMALLEPLGIGAMRASLLRGVRGSVLEIGAGTGANLGYYERGAEVTATEPDEGMRRRLMGKCEAFVRVLSAVAEALPCGDASFDHVVITLALCTVQEPARALAEVRRVLAPRGTLHFIEHVRFGNGLQGHAQDLLTPLWCRIAGGCHLNRRTIEAMEAAGFDVEIVERRTLGVLFPFVRGVARVP